MSLDVKAEVIFAQATASGKRYARRIFALDASRKTVEIDEETLGAMLATAFELGAQWQAAGANPVLEISSMDEEPARS